MPAFAALAQEGDELTENACTWAVLAVGGWEGGGFGGSRGGGAARRRRAGQRSGTTVKKLINLRRCGLRRRSTGYVLHLSVLISAVVFSKFNY